MSKSFRPEDLAGFEHERDQQDEQELDEVEESSESDVDSEEEPIRRPDSVDIENLPVAISSANDVQEPLDKLR